MVTEAVPAAPGYLGRVVDGGGEPVGTCFQVVPGVLVTAWHVLNDVGVAAAEAIVTVGPLVGGEVFPAVVEALDEVHDLAVLVSSGPVLSASVPGLAASEEVEIDALVVTTGLAKVPSEGTLSRLDAPGWWAGSALWETEVVMGRLRWSDVMLGMSGAPAGRWRRGRGGVGPLQLAR